MPLAINRPVNRLVSKNLLLCINVLRLTTAKGHSAVADDLPELKAAPPDLFPNLTVRIVRQTSHIDLADAISAYGGASPHN